MTERLKAQQVEFQLMLPSRERNSTSAPSFELNHVSSYFLGGAQLHLIELIWSPFIGNVKKQKIYVP